MRTNHRHIKRLWTSSKICAVHINIKAHFCACALGVSGRLPLCLTLCTCLLGARERSSWGMWLREGWWIFEEMLAAHRDTERACYVSYSDSECVSKCVMATHASRTCAADRRVMSVGIEHCIGPSADWTWSVTLKNWNTKAKAHHRSPDFRSCACSAAI